MHQFPAWDECRLAVMFGKSDRLDVNALIAADPQVGRAEVRAVAAMTLSGSATINGTSGPLGNDADQQLLGQLRQWSDVVLAGAATVRKENYFGVRTSPEQAQARVTRGQSPVPPIAVLSRSLALDPGSQFFTDTATRPLILTPDETLNDPATAERRDALIRAGAELVAIGSGTATEIIDALRGRGFTRILSEGGPVIFGALFDADLIDILHLTIDPVATAPVETPLFTQTAAGGSYARRLDLEHTAATADGTLFLRYRIDRGC